LNGAARIFVAAFAVSSPIAAPSGVPSDCDSPDWMNVSDAVESYAERSVKIIDLAARGDLRALEPLVSPSATFEVWAGDSGTGRERGARGAVEFARRLGATGFHFVIPFSGPIARDACKLQVVTIQFHGADGGRAHVAVFKYLKGRLIEANASGGSLFRGKIGPG
jgi:hypothetical protein